MVILATFYEISMVIWATYPKWLVDMSDISEMQLLISEMGNYLSSHNPFSACGNSIVDICNCHSYLFLLSTSENYIAHLSAPLIKC